MYRFTTLLIVLTVAISLSIACYASGEQTADQPKASASDQGMGSMGSTGMSGMSDMSGMSQSGAMGAGPGGGMSGDMMAMMGMMHPAIAVDDAAVYVVRGNEIIKLNKTDLSVIQIATLPQPQGMPPAQPGARGSGPSSARPQMQQNMAQMQQMTGPRYEQAFLENMIKHHEGAVQMSKLALNKAQHRELIDFARKTITNQGKEQQQFSSWLKTWYSASATKTPTQIDSSMINQLRGLSGRDFEIAFMRYMITHHSEAVMMGQDARQKAVHPEVKSAAAKIVAEQSKEIDQLKTWLSDWYRATP